MSEMEETVEVEFWEAISHERGFDSAGMYHDDTDFQLERISVCCDEPTGDRCVYFAILIDLEQGTMDSVRIGVLPETFLTDSLGAYANVSMTTHTLRTSQLFEDFATIDFKDCFEVNDMAESLPLAMARGCYEKRCCGSLDVPSALDADSFEGIVSVEVFSYVEKIDTCFDEMVRLARLGALFPSLIDRTGGQRTTVDAGRLQIDRRKRASGTSYVRVKPSRTYPTSIMRRPP